MDLIQRRQAAVMNQHYQRYSLDYFLDAQQRIGFTSIELWCGAQHFWLDDQHYSFINAPATLTDTFSSPHTTLTNSASDESHPSAQRYATLRS